MIEQSGEIVRMDGGLPRPSGGGVGADPGILPPAPVDEVHLTLGLGSPDQSRQGIHDLAELALHSNPFVTPACLRIRHATAGRPSYFGIAGVPTPAKLPADINAR